MKTDKLQLGDWVTFHDEGWASDGEHWKTDRTCRVTEIGGYYVDVEWYDEDGFHEVEQNVFDERIEPITLTSSILKKNGFEKDGDRGIKITHNMWWELGEIWAYQDDVGIALYPCLYVHDLQHALNTSGVKKDIEL